MRDQVDDFIRSASRMKVALGRAVPVAPPPAPQQEQPGIGGSVAMTGAGAYGVHRSRPLITGRTRLYHGTHEAGARAIHEQGLRPRSEVGGHGISDVIGDEAARTNAKKYVYMTPSAMEARSYAAQADAIQAAGGDVNKARLNMMQDPAAQGRVGNPFSRKGVVSADVPLWKLEQEGKLHANPELMGMGKKQWVDQALNKAPGGKLPGFLGRVQEAQGGKVYDSLNAAKTIEGGVGTQFLRGNKGYQRLGMQELGQYIKARPGRFAGGVGLAAGGATLAGVGINRLRHRFMPPQPAPAVQGAPIMKAAHDSEYGLAVARQLLKTAGPNLAVGLGKVIRGSVNVGKKVLGKAGDIGADVARGAGLNAQQQQIARRGAQVGTGYAGYRAGKKVKGEVDQFRYQHGLYSGGMY